MNKKTQISALLLAVMALNGANAFAATQSTPPVTVQATVDTQLSLSIAIREQTNAPGSPLTFGPVVTSMNHGTLTRSFTDGVPNALAGKTFHVFLGANSSGRGYTITSTMNPLTGPGGSQLPRALGVTPAVASSDGSGNDNITGDVLAASGDAIGTNKLLYTSNGTATAGASAATVDVVYGLSGGNADGSAPFTGWQAIPPSQTAGTYTSTVTYTITVA